MWCPRQPPEAYIFRWSSCRSLSISLITPWGQLATLCYSHEPVWTYAFLQLNPHPPLKHICSHMQTKADSGSSHTRKFPAFAWSHFNCSLHRLMGACVRLSSDTISSVWLSWHTMMKVSPCTRRKTPCCVRASPSFCSVRWNWL